MSAAVLEEAMASGASLDDVQFPQSVRDLCAGRLGFPHHGIPKALQRLVLKEKADTDVLTTRPGASLPPADVDAELAMLAERLGREATEEEAISSLLYPKVFADHCKFQAENSAAVTRVPTRAFWYGLRVGESAAVDVPADTAADAMGGGDAADSGAEVHIDIVLKRIHPLKRGKRDLVFLVRAGDNGEAAERVVSVEDQVAAAAASAGSCSLAVADKSDASQIASPLGGTVFEMAAAAVGAKVAKGAVLMVVCAMKMEVDVTAPFDCVVEAVEVAVGDAVDEGSLVARVSAV